MGRPRIYDIKIGEIVGDFTCIGETVVHGNVPAFIMKCNVCGREKTVIGAMFLGDNPRGTTHRSCGQFEKTTDKKFHDIWCGLRARTTNPNSSHYDCYGGRGIRSDAFKNFIDFKDSMYESYLSKKAELNGEIPSIERIDVNGDYTPENCTWIRQSEQKANQRKTVEFDAIFPDGHIEHHRNVMKFAKEHNMDDSSIYDVMNGRLPRYRKMKFVRTNPPDK